MTILSLNSLLEDLQTLLNEADGDTLASLYEYCFSGHVKSCFPFSNDNDELMFEIEHF